VAASTGADTARHFLAVLAVGIGLTACDASPAPSPQPPTRPPVVTASPEPSEVVALRARSLRLPSLAAGDRCPVTQPAPPDPPPPAGHALSNGAPASVLGTAPLFPDARYFGGDRHELLVTADLRPPGWYGTKVPWASGSGYRGWALIRTVRLDGPGHGRVQLQLADGPTMGEALAVNVQADWQFWSGSTEVTGPGCYAYQVDGSGFTEVIVFRAALAP
jgi:hypothetical protein